MPGPCCCLTCLHSVSCRLCKQGQQLRRHACLLQQGCKQLWCSRVRIQLRHRGGSQCRPKHLSMH
jgi:hypothetical protein